MNKKNTVSTLNAPNLTEKRRDGNTTRQINFAIELLLQGKTVICVDHAAPHSLDAGLVLARAIKRRLCSEHFRGAILNRKDSFYCLSIPALQSNTKNTIKVPNNIKFVQLGTKIYLVSPNQKLMMSMGAYKDRPSITFIQEYPDIPNYVKLYLVPCKREDLKPGDFAFRTEWNKPTFLSYGSYCVILKNGFYSKFNYSMDILTKNDSNSFWYKIVKESEL